MVKGYFITFEGGEGSGKSTQIRLLKEYLKGRGYDVIRTREPGGTHIGAIIRDILLNPKYKEIITDKAELLLYLTDRAQHVEEKIKPALEKGKIVISDRFIDSTTAYQVHGRGLSQQIISSLQDFSTDRIKPDLTLFLNVDTQEGLKRTLDEEFKQSDRIEEEGVNFHDW